MPIDAKDFSEIVPEYIDKEFIVNNTEKYVLWGFASVVCISLVLIFITFLCILRRLNYIYKTK